VHGVLTAAKKGKKNRRDFVSGSQSLCTSVSPDDNDALDGSSDVKHCEQGPGMERS
jgi:hypothetical protein